MRRQAKETHSRNLPQLLEELDCSVVISTYQAGQVISMGCHDEKLNFGFCNFPHAMGITRTPSGLALASKHEVWMLPAQRGLAPKIKPENTFDIAFLTRSCHITGPIMSHEIAWCNKTIVVVNTLCNCLATLDDTWSFKPLWKPPFINETTPSDRCHLNGLAIDEEGTSPSYVTMHGISNVASGWRENKATGGVLMETNHGEILTQGLSMPHSPRLYRGELYVLNSGEGQLLRINRENGEKEIIANLPGFTRGLDFISNTAIIGLSRIRESAIFGGLPVTKRHTNLHCGVAFINISTGQLQGFCWFKDGVEEIFAVSVLPGFRNPILIGPEAKADENDENSQTIWAVPPPKSSN